VLSPLEKPREGAATVVDDLLHVEGLSVLLGRRPSHWHTPPPSVLFCLSDVNFIMIPLPFPGPVPHIVPHSHVLEVKPFICELACVQVCLQQDVGNFDKFTVKAWRCSQCVHFEDRLSSPDSLQLVVEHDLVAVGVTFHIILKAVRTSKLELEGDVDFVSRD